MQTQVQARSCRLSVGLPGKPLSRAVSKHLRSVKVMVESNSKVVREYREDEGKVVVPSSSGEQGAIYVDDAVVRQAAAKRKDSMSKEMKQRLRSEYIGFGGAENQAMGNNYFVYISLVVAVLAVLSKLIGAI